MLPEVLKVLHVEHGVHGIRLAQRPEPGGQVPADALLRHAEALGRDGLTGGLREVAEHADGEGVGHKVPEVPSHLPRVHVGLFEHEGDAPVGGVQPVAHRLLAQAEEPGDDVLPLAVDVVQLHDIPLDGRDAREQVFDALEVVGPGAPVGISLEILHGAEAGTVEIAVRQAQ